MGNQENIMTSRSRTRRLRRKATVYIMRRRHALQAMSWTAFYVTCVVLNRELILNAEADA